MKKSLMFVGLFLILNIYFVLSITEGLQIKENIGDFNYTGEYFDDDCGLIFLDDPNYDIKNCNLHGANFESSYYTEIKVLANIEEYFIDFNNEDFVTGIKSLAEKEGMTSYEYILDGNNYLFLDDGELASYKSFAWHNGNKVIMINSNFDVGPISENEIVNLVQAYLDKYPSELIFIDTEELPECTDSDGGKDYYVKGIARSGEWMGGDYCYRPIGGSWTEVNSCTSEEDCSVHEAYCDSQATNNIGREIKACPDGCSDGACLGGEVEEVELIAREGFRHATWECYDGSFEGQGEESSCKPASLWQSYAEESCENKCSEETGKCGVNSFGVSGECSDVSVVTSSGSLVGKDVRTVEEKLDGLEQIVGQLLETVPSSELTDNIGSLVDSLGDGELKGDVLEEGLEQLEDMLHQLNSEVEFDHNENLIFEKALYYIKDIKNMLGSGGSLGGIPLICKNSCPFEDSCLPIGVRADGKYCSITGELLPQLESDAQCENHFECESSVCVNGQCLSEGFIQKIINFFKRIFGNQGNN